MDNTNWESILIEWVNCLNLSKPIQNVEELKDAEFFTNIQRILKKSSEYDVLTFLFNIFSEYYPKCIFENKSNIHMCDLSNMELNSITSLLMHYTCIHDRKDILTVPLCNSLDQRTQICIRNFLEKINKNITYEELHNIIKENNINDKLNISSPWMSKACSPLTHHSPLQEILRTPGMKAGRLQLKDREINKLKSELELERYEKADLQEEIKLQIDKNKKLDKQLEQKKSEISRLRVEVLSLESRTPPCYQDKDSREIQKRLRAEIQSLEQYIHQCDKEQEELRKEKDSAKEMVRKLESQVTLWQEKFFLTENNFQTLSERAKYYENQYDNLQIHCAELEALLDEIKSKPVNESLIDESYQTRRSLGLTPSCEDLAHSVVDVQLRDAQKQNEDLKVVLKESYDATSKLQVEMEKLNNRLKETNDKCTILIVDKEQLLLKITENEKILQDTNSKLRSSKEVIKQLQEEISSNSSEIIELNEKLGVSEKLKTKLDKDLENSKLLIDELHMSLKQLQENNAAKLKEYIQDKECLINAYELKIKEKETENTRLENQLKCNILENTQLADQLKEEKERLEKQLIIINEKDNTINNYEIKIKELDATNKQLLDDCCKLKEQINDLENQLNNNQKINQKLEKCLSDTTFELDSAKNQVKVLEEQIAIHSSEIQTLQENLSVEKSTFSGRYEKLKEEYNDLENQLNNTQKINYELEKTLSDTTFDLESAKSQLKALEEQIVIYSLEMQALQENLSIEKSLSNQKLKDLKEENNNLENQLNNTHKISEKLEKTLSCTTLELDSTQNQVKALEEQIAIYSSELQTLQENLSLEKSLSNQKVEELKEENNNLENQLNNTQKISQKLEKTLSDTTFELDSTQSQVKALEEQVAIYSTEMQTLQDSMSVEQSKSSQKHEKLKKEITNAQSQLSDAQSVNHKLEEALNGITFELNSAKNQVTSLEEQISIYSSNVQTLQENLSLENQENINLKNQLTSTQKINQELEKTLNVTTCELDSVKNQVTSLEEQVLISSSNVQTLQENLSLEKQETINLKNQLINTQKMNQELEKTLTDTTFKLDSAKNQVTSLEEQVSVSSLNVQTLQENLSLKQDEIINLKNQLTNAQKMNQDLEKTLRDTTFELDSAKNHLKALEEQIVIYTSEVQALQDNLSFEQSASSQKHEKLKADLFKLEKEVQSKHVNIEELEAIKCDLEKRTQILENKITDVNSNYHETLKEKECAIEEYVNKIKTVEEEKEILQKESNCMKNDIKELKMQLNEKIRDTGDLKENYDKIIEELSCTNQEKEDRVHRLECELEEMKENMEENVKDILLLKQENDAFKVNLIEKNVELDKIQVICDAVTEESNKLKEDLKEKDFTVTEFERNFAKKEKDLTNEIQQMNQLIQTTNDSMHYKDTELTKLKDENKKFQERIEDLNAEVSKLKVIKEELTKSCLDYKEYWHVEVEEVEKIQKNLRDINNHLEEEKNAFFEKVRQKDNQIYELENKIVQLTNQKDNLIKEISDARETISTVENHLQSDNHLIAEYKDKMLNLKNKINEIYADLSSEVQIEKDIIDQLQKINDQAIQLRQDKSKLEEEISEIKDSKTIALANYDLLEENMMELKSVLIAVKDELRNIINSVKDKTDISHLKITLDSSEETITDTDKELECMIEYISQLKNYIELFTTKEKEYLTQIENLREELDEAFSKCSDIIQEKTEYKIESESQITDMTCNLHKIIENYNKLEKDHNQILVESSQLKSEVSDLKQKLEMCQNEIHHKDELEQEILHLKKELKEKETKSQEYKSKQESEEEQLKEIKAKNARLNEEVMKSKDSLKIIEENVDLLNAQFSKELKEKDNDLTILKQTIINLESMIEQRDLEIIKLQNVLDDLRKHIDLLNKQNESLSAILNCSKDQNVKDIIIRDAHYETLITEHKNAFDNLNTVNDKLILDLSMTKSELNNANIKIQTLLKDRQALQETAKERDKVLTEYSALQLTNMNLDQLISELKTELEETYQTISNLRCKKEELEVELEVSKKEAQKAKRMRAEVLESQTQIMKQTETNISRAKENAVEVRNDLMKHIEDLEKEIQSEQELRKRLENEMHTVKQAFGNITTANSTLELENSRLRTVIRDKAAEIQDYVHIKEAYEKLLEENNKLMTDVDTIKYKRLREKEDIKELLKEEREKAKERETKKVQETRLEYEEKLEKMKEKMLKLYKEEQSKSKVMMEKKLSEAEQKIRLLETERDMFREREAQRSLHASRESLSQRVKYNSNSLKSNVKPSSASVHNSVKSNGRPSSSIALWNQSDSRKVKSSTGIDTTRRGHNLDKKVATREDASDAGRVSISSLPGNLGHNLHMEDEEDDMFNNKYLSDLKQGRGILTSGRESTASRVSILAQRNSMLPPHLKSSYPAEIQFVSPTRYKEDEIKTGNVGLDDSMSKLLPGEKNDKRQRKDFGTTSYKKPGPPTPSKNGGRLSLHGNEVHPLRDHNEKTPTKKVTPGRLKALFMGRNANSLRDNSENISTPTRGKRRSIFRKPK